MKEVYPAIEQLESTFSVASLCTTLHVSRSAYYTWKEGSYSERQREDHQLMPLIRGIFWEHKRRYGARRITQELATRAHACGTRRVSRLMRHMGLRAIQPRSYRPKTTESRHTLGYSPNLLLDAPPSRRIDQVWVGDITYVPLVDHDFLYLALLMDLYSRRIVGWSLAEHMQETLVLKALRQAIALRQPRPGLVHHTDRGGQYAGTKYRKTLDRARMAQSMSRADNCYDNAFMESCFGTIKLELEMEAYENDQIAHKEIVDYIRYYNMRRRHSALHYLTPAEFERLHS